MCIAIFSLWAVETISFLAGTLKEKGATIAVTIFLKTTESFRTDPFVMPPSHILEKFGKCTPKI